MTIKVRINWPLVQEKKCKINFQDDGHGGHLGFPIRTILAMFDLQITPIRPTNFQGNWPFGSGVGAKYIFKMATMAAGFDLRSTNLAIFYLQVAPILSTKFQVSWPFG